MLKRLDRFLSTRGIFLPFIVPIFFLWLGRQVLFNYEKAHQLSLFLVISYLAGQALIASIIENNRNRRRNRKLGW